MRNSKKLALAAAIVIIIAAIFASSLIAGNLAYRYGIRQGIHHAMTASRLDGFLHPDGVAEITLELDGETYVHEVALY